MMPTRPGFPVLFATVLVAGCATERLTVTSAGRPTEGPLAPFLGEPALHVQPIYRKERFPNVVVSVDGTVLALFGSASVRVRRSVDGGDSFEEPISIANPGFHGGGATVDEVSGEIFAFVESSHPPSILTIYRSEDDGETWQTHDGVVQPDLYGHVPSMHMNEGGITLRDAKHAGRLIRPARWYSGGNDKRFYPMHYTTAIYSDDHGRTWQTSKPFPENGTGEAAIAELADGRLYYNSRVHWPKAPSPTRRRAAWSSDGGASWDGWQLVNTLPDGRQNRAYGCMGGLTRLPVEGRDVLIFSNLDTSADVRERITVWASFDGGATWPVKRLVHEGPSAYSSLAAGRPQTPSEGWIYLHFEASRGSQMARFNLSWVLGGEATGDGRVPDWVGHEGQ